MHEQSLAVLVASAPSPSSVCKPNPCHPWVAASRSITAALGEHLGPRGTAAERWPGQGRSCSTAQPEVSPRPRHTVHVWETPNHEATRPQSSPLGEILATRPRLWLCTGWPIKVRVKVRAPPQTPGLHDSTGRFQRDSGISQPVFVQGHVSVSIYPGYAFSEQISSA